MPGDNLPEDFFFPARVDENVGAREKVQDGLLVRKETAGIFASEIVKIRLENEHVRRL